MSEFQEGFEELFDAAIEAGAGNTIKFNRITRPCVASGLRRESKQRETGYEINSTPTCEMRATDYRALGIPDRGIVEIDGFQLTLVAVELDVADPQVKLFFEHQS